MGLTVRPSKRQYKKLDVFGSDGGYVASIGDVRYADFPTYLATKGRGYAEKRRELYLKRHKKDSGVAGNLARELLW
jgi:hypothetical protein